MLWSLLKILIFMAIVAALTFGVGFLTEMDSVAVLRTADHEVVLTPFVAAIGAAILLIAVWALFRIVGLLVAVFRFLVGDETAISRYLNRRSERKGYEALADGMMALAAGEGRLAIRKAERAESYLKRPELTKLVVAQGAEMVGDAALARDTFKALVQDDRTRFVGVRGLMKQKLADGDTETAMKLAERALALRPKNEDVQTTLFQLQAKYEDWAGARTTLAAALKAGNLPRDVHSRRDAVLALAHARDAMAGGQVEEAAKIAANANRMAPTLVPAAVMAARFAIADGKPKVAQKIIRDAWSTEPHPDLAAAFAEIAPDESPSERLKRFRLLLGKHPDHSETKLLEAELQIAAEDFPAARRALGDLAETEPTARSLTIMAAIERGEGAEDRVVRAWLAKAVTAPRGPQWVCEVDGKTYPEWTPVTDGGFDTLTWKTPVGPNVIPGNTAGMLPLIVGDAEARPPQDAAQPEAETDAEVIVATGEDGDGQAPDPGRAAAASTKN